MRTVSYSSIQPADYAEAIGLHHTADGIIVFYPGDESTPEWLALHPPIQSEQPDPNGT